DLAMQFFALGFKLESSNDSFVIEEEIEKNDGAEHYDERAQLILGSLLCQLLADPRGME
ncbi:MAG: hypothetical protein HY966_00150, partial [Ignavibacteriales bacterium]|nr:hypothetical protein [Ignavibacteriales bacterium]